MDELAVKPVTQFPVEISNEDVFASFKNVRHVTIKKVNEIVLGDSFYGCTNFCLQIPGKSKFRHNDN